MSLNITSLLGRIGKDPEVRHLGSGSTVANFTIATTETYKDKAGNKKEETQWHSCVAWGKTAEIAEKYVQKGDQLYVSGKLVYEQYEKDGVKHTVAKIKVEKLVLLGSGKKSESKPMDTPPPPIDQQFDEPTDEMPFIVTLFITVSGLMPYLF